MFAKTRPIFIKMHQELLIIEFLQRKNYPTLRQIEDHLFANGYERVGRTIHRYFETCRNDLGLDIKYDHSEKGYYIDEEGSLNPKRFSDYYRRMELSQLLSNNYQEIHSEEKFIYLDDIYNHFRGIENINPLIECIKKRNMAEFEYTKFRGSPKKHTIEPHLLKEAGNRWYLIAKRSDGKAITFGLDRMQNVKRLNRKFKWDPNLHKKKNFDNIVGIEVPEGNPVEIRFDTTLIAGEYFNSLPIHETQIHLNENDKKSTSYQFRIELIPNREFYQRLLMWAEHVTVVSPSNVKKYYVDLLKKGIQLNR